jgi:hypothetical protein
VQRAPAREAGKSREWNPEDEAPFISLYEHEKGSSLLLLRKLGDHSLVSTGGSDPTPPVGLVPARLVSRCG